MDALTRRIGVCTMLLLAHIGFSATAAAAPEYALKEFQYFADRSDEANPAKTRAELTPLPLAPRFAVRVFAKERADEIKGLIFSRYGATITSIPEPISGYADFLADFPPDTKQDALIQKLNAMSLDSGGRWDVAPVFIVDGKEAVAGGVAVAFAVPLSAERVRQMLGNYGGIGDVELSEMPAHWVIVPKKHMFLVDTSYAVVGGKRSPGKFDMHLLLLANLLETQRIMKGVPVISARPVFLFLEGPLLAELSMEWPSDTIGGVRELVLTVTVLETERVRFDPSKVPLLGTGDFQLLNNGNTVFPGWAKLVDENGRIVERNSWAIEPKREVRFGARVREQYVLRRRFHLFQPEESWSVKLAVPYEHQDKKSGQWKLVSAQVRTLSFFVLAHRAKEGKISMPAPASYGSGALQEFSGEPVVVSDANTHWFSAWIARFEALGVGAKAAGWLAYSLILLGALLIGSVLWLVARERKATRARAPKAVPFMNEHEFSARLLGFYARNDSPRAIRRAMLDARALLEEILSSRLPFDVGHTTAMSLKEFQRTLRKDDVHAIEAITRALRLFDATNAIDAPEGEFDKEFLLKKLEELRDGIPLLYGALTHLPPRLSEGERHDVSVSLVG